MVVTVVLGEDTVVMVVVALIEDKVVIDNGLIAIPYSILVNFGWVDRMHQYYGVAV